MSNVDRGRRPAPVRAAKKARAAAARFAPQPIEVAETDRVPQHNFMADNGRSNVHNDAYMSDTYDTEGPTSGDLEVLRGSLGGLCISLAFDKADRIFALAASPTGARSLLYVDPVTLEKLASYRLPRGRPKGYAGSAYFYLDNHDRAVVATTEGTIEILQVVERGPAKARRAGLSPPRFKFDWVTSYDISDHIDGGSILSAVPDWKNNLWFVTQQGMVGFVQRGEDGVLRGVAAVKLGEGIFNSMAVDEDGGVYVVSDAHLYRFEAETDAGGQPSVRRVWRGAYPNDGVAKPGQVAASSGTTPTLQNYKGKKYVAIADNARETHVVVYRREPDVDVDKEGNKAGLFEHAVPFVNTGSSTENSLVGVNTSLVVENNYGYADVGSTQGTGVTEPGLTRVDFDGDGGGDREAWTNTEVRIPSVVSKLSLRTGLVYTYTKKADGWYFAAVNFHDGEQVFEVQVRTEPDEQDRVNCHYAGLYLGPDGRAYVGTLEGIVSFSERSAARR